MSQSDREKWDARWAAEGSVGEPSPWVRQVCHRWLPRAGRALDLAGGAGRHAKVLAEHGLDVTLSDISEVGVKIGAGLHARIHPDVRDLDGGDLPPGPFAVVLVYHFLDRAILGRLPEILAPGGFLIVCIATRTNLERHPHPAARFLLEPQELRRAFPGFDRLVDEEGWTEEGRHEARIVARKPGIMGAQ